MQDAETRFGITEMPAAEIAPRLAWELDTPFNCEAPTAGDPLPVRGNHGRWIVECDHCSSAQLAASTDHRFMCVTCGNAYQDGAWRPVEWPEDPDELAAHLEARPAHLANWEPGETADDLVEQNQLLAAAEWSAEQAQANQLEATWTASDDPCDTPDDIDGTEGTLA
jgi:hypothetical protein